MEVLNQRRSSNIQQGNIKVEKVFVVMILIFGIISTFITFPLANGDEGFHLSKSYSMFSSNMPESMSQDTVRGLELHAVGILGNMSEFDVNQFNTVKLPEVVNDGISFNIPIDSNILLQLDIAHLPPAIGVLIGRLIYPSYGVMLYCARLVNLMFFVIALYFIIKASKIRKWPLLMLFSVPFIQKMASASYDVFAYVAIAAFAVNILALGKMKSANEIDIKKVIYTLFTIILVLFSKNNYLFALFAFLFLPMFWQPILNVYLRQKRPTKIGILLAILIVGILALFVLNRVFGLYNFTRVFLANYFDLASASRRGRDLFTVTPTILPDLFNIIWLAGLLLVMILDKNYEWDIKMILGGMTVFLINWVGIYAGFYMILGRPNYAFDDLSGRYLHPFIIFFLPWAQSFGKKYQLQLPDKELGRIAIISTIFIMVSYLVVCYYRGYILGVSPTWSN